MKTIKAEPRQGDKVAVIIRVDSTVQEEIILTAKEGMKLASEILNALPNAPIRSWPIVCGSFYKSRLCIVGGQAPNSAILTGNVLAS